MGILNLKYGYAALIGRGAARLDPTSKYNHDKIEELRDFCHFFYDNYHQFENMITRSSTKDTTVLRNSFAIKSDVKMTIRNNLRDISREIQSVSMVVGSLDVDLKNRTRDGILRDPRLINEFIRKCEEYELQIFEIHNKKYPLTPNILTSLGGRMAVEMMNNAIEVREQLSRWVRNWDR